MKRAILAVTVLAALGTGALPADAQYVVETISNPYTADGEIRGLAVNDSGLVAGYMKNPLNSNYPEAFVYEPGTGFVEGPLTELPKVLPAPATPAWMAQARPMM